MMDETEAVKKVVDAAGLVTGTGFSLAYWSDLAKALNPIMTFWVTALTGLWFIYRFYTAHYDRRDGGGDGL